MEARFSVIFAAGGTGGHIFPALAVAEALRTLHPSVEPVFVASQRAIDRQVLEGARVEWSAIPARPLVVRPRALAGLVWNWGGAVRGARGAMRSKGRRALALVTTGGFVAPPAAQAARAERIPSVLINLDAVPGRANRLLATRAARKLTTADGPDVPADWVRIPPIVRAGARSGASPASARLAFGLDPKTPTLLVTGGSQGARSINEFLLAVVREQPEMMRGWQVIHQCGGSTGTEPEGSDSMERRLQEAYDATGVPAAVMPFIDRMADAWAAAECAIARAGAGNVAEVWANGVPTLFLPYPYHADNHQARNAAVLTEAGAALIATDRVDPGANLESAGPVLTELVGSAERRAAMRSALERLGPADGALRAARVISEVIAPMAGEASTR